MAPGGIQRRDSAEARAHQTVILRPGRDAVPCDQEVEHLLGDEPRVTGIASVLAKSVGRVGQRDDQRCDLSASDQVVEHDPQVREADEVGTVVNDQSGVRVRRVEPCRKVDADLARLAECTAFEGHRFDGAFGRRGIAQSPVRDLVSGSVAHRIGAERIVSQQWIQGVLNELGLSSPDDLELVLDP